MAWSDAARSAAAAARRAKHGYSNKVRVGAAPGGGSFVTRTEYASALREARAQRAGVERGKANMLSRFHAKAIALYRKNSKGR